ncbi:hypothetical protein ACFQZE_01430 [Paenibacillus sp. GCM10027627]|uniref:hypothetical protein n=1 Tax=unclassified Paenibacillus TaxID=185978 RepID=UPI003642D67B
MFNYISSEKGGTLMIVFGFIVMLAIVVTPIALSANTGLLQAKTNGNSEVAYTKAHSTMTVFGKLYKAMLANDGTANTEANIVALINEVSALNGVEADIVLIKNGQNKPVAVKFTGQAGAGNQNRSSQVEYKLQALYVPPVSTPPVATPTPTATPAPTATPTPTPALADGNKVLLKNSTTVQNNKLFAACYLQPANGQALPLDHIMNDFTPQQFNNWFNPTADSYLNQVPNAIAAAFPQPFLDARFAYAASLPNQSTSAALQVKENRAAIIHQGPVTFTATASTVTVEKNGDGYAAKVGGDLQFTDIGTSMIVFKGKTEVGGNLSIKEVRDGKSITFKDDLIVRGNMTLANGSTVDTIVVEGDLVVGGQLLVSNTLKKLIVKGDLLVAGNVTSANVVSQWQVDGTMIVNGNVAISNTLHRFLIGRDVVVKGNMSFNNPLALGSGDGPGAFSIGGSLKVFGTLDIVNSVNGFMVAGDVIVNKSITFQNHIKDGFQIGGSILVKENLQFTNTVDSLKVNGNVVALGKIQFDSTIENGIGIGGTMAANGDISFKNTIKPNSTLSFGQHLITKSNLSFANWTLNGSLKLGGHLLVYKDADLHNLDKDWKSSSMKGFYVAGTTRFNSEYAQSWYVDGLTNGTTEERICIN